MFPQILQWNSQSIKIKKPELLNLIDQYKPAVAAVSETWLVPGSRFRVPGYSCLREDRDDGYAGTALLVKRSLTFTQIPLPPHGQEINAIALRALGVSFLSLYIANPTASLIPSLQAIISSLTPPVIVMGDFNSHHISWGSYKCDPFSHLLLDLLDNLNLCIINDGSPTRRVLPHQNPKSAVDLTITSPSLSSSCLWKRLSSTFGSDHFPILISLHSQSYIAIDPCPLVRYRLSKANWDDFSSSLDVKMDSIPQCTSNNFLSIYDNFVDAILSSANSHIPIKKPRNHRVSPPWWDSECTLVIGERNDAETLYISDMSMDNFIKYKHAAARAKRTIHRKKRAGWNFFCEGLSPRTRPSEVWRNIRRFRCSMNIENVTSNDPAVWLDAFADRLSPPFSPNSYDLPSPPSFISACGNMDAPFSIRELECALEGLVDSSPGVDGIPYSFLTKSNSKCKFKYLELINFFFDFGSSPTTWSKQIIIPILKPGKNPSDPKSRRPIALSSVLCKIMEHLLKTRLEWFLEHNNILAKSQFGFRKGMSTMDSLSIIVTDIHLAFKKKQYLVAAFLDVTSAYDNVQLSVLRQTMQNLSIPEKLTRFICNLLMERSISIKNTNCPPTSRTVWKGLPQGSVMSPLLYNLYTYDLERCVTPFCNILQYADDLALYLAVDSCSVAESRLNSALMYLNDWLDAHGLSLSASKSSSVIFTKKRTIPDLELLIEDDPIPTDNKVKFLGVILDSRLTGIPHLSYVAQKCEKGINVLRSLSGVWWGAHPYSQKLIYNAIIRSHFDYGGFLLDPCNKAATVKISRIQAKCLRIISGTMKSSPTNALQVECVDPPLHLRNQYLCDRFFFKLVQVSSHPLLSKLQRLFQITTAQGYRSLRDLPCLLRSFINFFRIRHPIFHYETFPLFSFPYHCLIFKPQILLDFGIQKDSRQPNRQFNRIITEKWSEWLPIFTDASKLSSSGNVGAAVWIPKFRIILNFKLPPGSSVFSGEATAILEAILYAESHSLDNTLIFSDSLSSLYAISANPFKSKLKSPLVLKIRHALFRCLSRGIIIILAWIPAHSGISGNEIVDSCAKEAVESGDLSHFKIHTQDLVSSAKTRLEKSWESSWQSSRTLKGRHYGQIQPLIPKKPWFFKYREMRKTVTSTICRLRLGHSCTPVHLAKIRIRDSSLCECGLADGTPDHLFFECTKLQTSLYDILPGKIPRPVNLKFLLTLSDPSFIHILSKFITSNKIKL